MAFQEKSAWIMSFALVLGGLVYFAMVASLSAHEDGLAPPIAPQVVIYTAVLVLVAILGHIIVAVMAPREANAELDERERRVFERAGHRTSWLLGVGVLLSLGAYLLTYDGDVLFYGVFASLMLAQLAEYAYRIFLYRTRV